MSEWTTHLSGKGYGDYQAKVDVLEFMRAAVGKMPGHPLDETSLHVMSMMGYCFMTVSVNVSAGTQTYII